MRRIFIVVILLLVVGGIAAFVLLRNNPNGGTAPLPGQTQSAQVNPAATVAPTSTPAPTAMPTIDIVVALQKINRGQTITPDLITVRAWPDASAPVSAITEPELVIGKIARTDIERESPIKVTDITGSLADLAAVGSDASAILPPGTRMVAIPIDALTSNGFAIRPGDRIDVVITSLFVDVDEDFQSSLPNDIQFIVLNKDGFTLAQPVDGRFDTIPFSYTLGEDSLQSAFPVVIRPNEPPRPRVATQVTVQDALVIWVGLFPEDGRLFVPAEELEAEAAAESAAPTATPASGGATPTAGAPLPLFISVAVSAQEAVVLSYLIEAGVPINLLLRPANETGRASVQHVDLDYIMNAYRITVPRKLPYGLEPAIRSIRQLVRSNTVDLTSDTTP
jgi:pilus assembly protein CpaB